MKQSELSDTVHSKRLVQSAERQLPESIRIKASYLPGDNIYPGIILSGITFSEGGYVNYSVNRRVIDVMSLSVDLR